MLDFFLLIQKKLYLDGGVCLGTFHDKHAMVHGDALAELQEMIAIMHGTYPCGAHGLLAAMHEDH